MEMSQKFYEHFRALREGKSAIVREMAQSMGLQMVTLRPTPDLGVPADAPAEMRQALEHTFVPEEESTTKFWCFHQNNSGGYFQEPAIDVLVLAPTEELAFVKAFEKGVDPDAPSCGCCGARWCSWAYELSPAEARTRILDALLGRGYQADYAKADGVPMLLVVL